jgi:hypothetical protein
VSEPSARPPLHPVSGFRLVALLALFAVACLYTIVSSERFARETKVLIVRTFESALGRRIAFDTISVSFLPPAVTLTQVRVEGDSRDPVPFFRAEEVTAGGAISFVGRTLSIGRLTAVHPFLHIAVYPDGSDNLPPGLKTGGRRGGVKVHVGRIVARGGEFAFNETRVPMDLEMRAFLAELARVGPENRFRGRLGCRLASIALPGAERFRFSVDARFDLDRGRLHVDSLAARGPFGDLRAIGEIPDLSKPQVSAYVTGHFDAAVLESIFRLNVPFHGDATVRANVQAGSGGFRVLGNARIPKLTGGGFTFEDVSTSIVASPRGVTASIEHAGFEGGTATGLLAIGPLSQKVQTFELLVEGRDLSVERFFGDIDLPHTGLAAAADADVALRWRGDDLEKGDGGGALRFKPLAASGAAVPVSGGGPFAIRAGFVDMQGVNLEMPRSRVGLSGGFALGQWQPRMRFTIDSDDFRMIDRVARNFSGAIQKKPAGSFGLEGSGRIEGSIEGRWALPHAEARISASNAAYGGARLGTIYSELTVDDGAFLFHPLRAFDGDARLALTGYARYQPRPGSPDFDLKAEAVRFPIETILKFLDLDYPVTGRVTGSLPIAGTGKAVTGAGDLLMENAVVYGQPIDRMTTRAVFTPGSMALQNVRGQIGEAVFGGEAEYSFAASRYRFRLAGDHMPVSRVPALAAVSPSLSGLLSFHAQGEGTVERPQVSVSVQLSGATFIGRPLADDRAPALEARIENGVLTLRGGVEGRWSIEAHGPVETGSEGVSFSVSVPDLAALAALFPSAPANLGGELEARGTVVLDPKDFSIRRAEATVTRLRLVSGARAGAELSASSPIRLRLAGGRLEVERAELAGPDGRVAVSGSVDTAGAGAFHLRTEAKMDPALLTGFVWPDAEAAGALTADLQITGTFALPQLQGTIGLANGRFRARPSPYLFENMSASVHLAGTTATLDFLHARVGGGDLDMTGDARLDGLAISEFRLVGDAQNVTVRTFEDMRVKTNAELTVVGTPAGSTVRGQVTLLSGTYTKDFAPSLASLFAPSRSGEFAAAHSTWQDRVALDLRITSSASLEVRNNLARLTGTVDLVARGTLENPVLLGQILVDEGGKITFQDVKYEVLSGSITFGNPLRTEPVVDVSAQAEVKGYEINVQAAGTLGDRPRLQFHFSSDPPLTEEQVASLLLTGSAPDTTGTRPGSTTSSLVGSIAGLAFRPVTSKVQQLFRLDRFQIDPVLQGSPGSSGGAVITIGKNITKDLSVTYSYSAETNSQSMVLVEYQIDANKVLQASKDENNVYSIDIKLRKRF